LNQRRTVSAEIPPQNRFLGVLIAAVIIVGLCCWNYWYLIIETNDRVPPELAPLVERETGATVARDDVRIGVFESLTTRRFFREMDFDYSGVLKEWNDFLRSLGFTFNDFARIEQIEDFDVVIFPFSSCLSEYEARRIKEYIAAGGAVLMTGAVGSRFNDGRWRDQPVYGDIIGARFVGNANPSPQGPARLQLNRQTPVSLRLNPRSIIDIPVYNQVLVVRPFGSRMESVATTVFSAGEGRTETLTAFNVGPYLQGKVAWSGFRLGSHPAGNETIERAVKELFTNTIAWLADRPRVSTPLWPAGYQAALALVVDAESESRLRLLTRIAAVGKPVGVLVAPHEARSFADLPGAKDLDIEWILHIDREFLTAVSEKPTGWLTGVRQRMESIFGKPVHGIRYEALTSRQAAEEALEGGFSYLLAPPSETIEEYPEIYTSRRMLGPLESPEVLSLAPFRTSLPESSEPTDCDFVLLTVDEFLASANLQTRLGEREGFLWVTTPSQIVAWRADRNSVVMNEEFLPGNRLRLNISNGSYREFENFPFRVHFQEPVESVAVWPKAVGVPPPEVLSGEGRDWTFAIRNFRSGRTLEYIFTPDESPNGEDSEVE